MLPNDAHYNPNYILMLKSNASIHHWNEIQMLTIDKLSKKVHRTQNCLCIFIRRKDKAVVIAVQEYLFGEKKPEYKIKIPIQREKKKIKASVSQ